MYKTSTVNISLAFNPIFPGLCGHCQLTQVSIKPRQIGFCPALQSATQTAGDFFHTVQRLIRPLFRLAKAQQGCGTCSFIVHNVFHRLKIKDLLAKDFPFCLKTKSTKFATANFDVP